MIEKLNTITKIINEKRLHIQAMKKHPVKNFFHIGRERRQIQALQEGQRDILTSNDLRGSSTTINSNKYKTYTEKVDGAYKMYDASTKYGGELFSGIVDIRKAFISGEGLSVTSSNEKKEKFLNSFIKLNKLDSVLIMQAALMEELEGQLLFTLATKQSKDGTKKEVITRLFSWYLNKYKVNYDSKDNQLIKSITYNIGDKDEKTINTDSSVYMDFYSSVPGRQEPHPKCGKVLTQVENISIAAYDLRVNTSLYGRNTLMFETKNDSDASAIKKELQANSYDPGKGFAGTAKASYLEPSGSAGKVIIDDILINLKFISSMTGIPVHWLAWPELMSNRATAENLHEVISAATKNERLVMIAGMYELMEKACIIAVDNAIEDASILEGDIDIKLPLISIAALKQLGEIWVPLWMNELISTFDMQNMIPGIDPAKTNRAIEKEKEEKRKNNEKDASFNNKSVDNLIKSVQNNNTLNNDNKNKQEIVK